MPCQARFVRAGATSHNAIAAKLNERKHLRVRVLHACHADVSLRYVGRIGGCAVGTKMA
jgi:hypothetical protein